MRQRKKKNGIQERTEDEKKTSHIISRTPLIRWNRKALIVHLFSSAYVCVCISQHLNIKGNWLFNIYALMVFILSLTNTHALDLSHHFSHSLSYSHFYLLHFFGVTLSLENFTHSSHALSLSHSLPVYL